MRRANLSGARSDAEVDTEKHPSYACRSHR